MKVLFITKTLNYRSGWGRYSSLLISEMKNKNINAGVISEDNGLLSLSNKFNLISNILKVRRVIKKYDVVHALDGWPYGVYAYFGVLGTNKKLFISGVGTYSVVPLHSLFKGIILKLAYRRAKKIFCISKYTERKILEKVSLNNTEVIYLGNTILKKYSNEKKNLNNSYPVLLTVGAIKDRKGQFYVLKAVNLLKKIYPNIKYYVVGSFDDMAYVNKMKEYAKMNNMEDNLELIEGVDDDGLVKLYNNCDIFLLCSISTDLYFEGFGLVLIEAASFGKPVIGSLGSGTEEAVNNGCNGYLVRQENSRDIYDKILDILNGDMEKMSNCSVDWSSKFTWSKTAEKYINFYKNEYK